MAVEISALNLVSSAKSVVPDHVSFISLEHLVGCNVKAMFSHLSHYAFSCLSSCMYQEDIFIL